MVGTRSSRRAISKSKTAIPTKKKVTAKAQKPGSVAPKSSSSLSSSKIEGTNNETIVNIEACKQWSVFKTRANKIANGLEGKAIVKINEEKPGKGNFVVTVVGKEKPVVELLGLKRPFPALKALDMDQVVKDILNVLGVQPLEKEKDDDEKMKITVNDDSTKKSVETTEEISGDDDEKPVVSIEACKQWNAFKTRANKIAKGLEGKAVVKINEEKPGKGNFIVKIVGQEKAVVELLGLKRPFPPLKALDMDQVVQDISKAI